MMPQRYHTAISLGYNMSSYGLNDIRSGMKLIIDNDPCVVDNEFVKPEKVRHLIA